MVSPFQSRQGSIGVWGGVVASLTILKCLTGRQGSADETGFQVILASTSQILHLSCVQVVEEAVDGEVSPQCILLRCPIVYLGDAALCRDINSSQFLG